MVFSSTIFLFFFLPIVLLLHTLLMVHLKYSFYTQNAFLLLASLLFYAWGEPQHVLIIILSSIINFHSALFLQNSEDKRTRKIILLLAIILNLGLLSYFKYAKMLHETAIAFAGPLPPHWNFLSNIALPLGISFYTFQGLSYVIDVYWRKAEASRSYIDFACYLCLFPQLVAGPIVRYVSIAKELTSRTLTFENFAAGVQRFVWGLAKKVLIADTFGRVADATFNVPAGELPAEAAWLGIICYTLQIYFDFSGYSDMAIGMGRMMGFTFPENFNYPYISRSIREFWQRWHITLSQWFRDYLYIPLGGNRCAQWRVALNLLIVFALCGLWHGATYGFLVWGLYHGFFLAFERYFPHFVTKMPRALQHGYTIFVVMMGWVIFRTEEIGKAGNYFAALLGLHTPQTYAVNEVWLNAHGYALPLAFTVAILAATPLYSHLRIKFSNVQQRFCLLLGHVLSFIITISVLLLSCLPVVASSYKSFIYFRF